MTMQSVDDRTIRRTPSSSADRQAATKNPSEQPAQEKHQPPGKETRYQDHTRQPNRLTRSDTTAHNAANTQPNTQPAESQSQAKHRTTAKTGQHHQTANTLEPDDALQDTEPQSDMDVEPGGGGTDSEEEIVKHTGPPGTRRIRHSNLSRRKRSRNRDALGLLKKITYTG